MKSKFLVLAASLALTTTLVACGGAPTTETAPAGDAMEQDGGAMEGDAMQEDGSAMEGDAMKEEDGSAMEGDAMKEEGGAMEETGSN